LPPSRHQAWSYSRRVDHLTRLNELREQLLYVDAALVWVNPIEADQSRASLRDAS